MHLLNTFIATVLQVSGFVWYKLSTQASLKIIKKKKAYYEKKKMSREEIKMDVVSLF